MTTKENKPAVPRNTGMSKEGLGLFALAILALAVVAVAGYTVFATDNGENSITNNEAVVFVDGDFEFQVLSQENKTVAIIGNNCSGDVVLPETAFNTGTGTEYSVTAIKDLAFYNSKAESVKIAKSISTIESKAFFQSTFIRAFSVADGNNHFFADDQGVLYSHDKKTLVKFPNAKTTETNTYKINGDVVVVAPYAFASNTWVTNISNGSSVEKISDYAFYGNNTLVSFSMVDSHMMKEIGSNAFRNCTSLKLFDTSSITTIGSYAFYNTGLEKVVIVALDKSLAVGEYAFSNCNSLSEIKITGSFAVEMTFGNHAFSDCSFLKNVEFSCGNTETKQLVLGDYAFSNCNLLDTAIFMPHDCSAKLTLGKYAFSDCHALKTLKLLDDCTSISEGAFQNCTSFTEFAIGKHVSFINNKAFIGCTAIKKFTVESGNAVFKIMDDAIYNNFNELVSYPGAKHGDGQKFNLHKSTEKILPYAFSSCKNNFNLVISDCSKLTEIGDYAFYESGVHYVTGKNKIASIGNFAFYGCKNLYSVEAQYGVIKSIGEYAFCGCENLSKFAQKLSEDKFVIPGSVEHIADTAFIGCKTIAGFYVDGGSTFKSVDGVLYTNDLGKLITYPTGKTDATYTIPKETSIIGEFAFFGAMNLTAIDVAAGNDNFHSDNGVLYNMNKSAIVQYPCGKTGEYTVLETTTFINSHSFAFSKIEGISGTTVKTIDDYAFYNCTELKFAITTGDLVIIGDHAFSGCINLCSGNKTLTIGANVTDLGTGAFENCTAFVNLEMLSDNPVSLEHHPFKGCNLDYIFVPCNSIERYKAADIYKDYADYIYSVVSDPVPSKGLVYNGKEQTGFTDDKFVFAGNTATDAGEHIASVKPKFELGYVWDKELAHGAHSITWSIDKCTLGFEDVSGVETKQYDGTNSVEGKPGIVFSNVPAEGATIHYTADYHYASKDAGSWSINVTDIVLSDATAINYKLSDDKFTTSPSFVIEKYEFSIEESYTGDYKDDNVYTIPNVPTGVGTEMITVTYKTTGCNAGTYVFGASEKGFTLTYFDGGKLNYAITGAADFVIQPIEYDMSGFHFSAEKKEYNGKDQTIIPQGLPTGLDGSTLKYDYVQQFAKDAGEHFIIIKLKSTSVNYYVDPQKSEMSAKLIITTAPLNVTDEYDDYNGTMEHSISRVTRFTDEIILHYTLSSSADVGTYVYKTGFDLKLEGKASGNYYLTDVGNLTIKAIDYDMSGIEFNSETKTYNAMEQTLKLSGKELPTGLDGKKLSVTYEGKYTNVGEYDIIAKFSTTSKNYNIPADMTAKLTIVPYGLVLEAKSDDYYNGYVFEFDNVKGLGTDEFTVYYVTGTVNAGTYVFESDYEKLTDGKFTVFLDNESEPQTKNYYIESAGNFLVNKIKFDQSGISFEDASCVYDGKPHNIRVSGEIPQGLDGSKVVITYTDDITDVPGGVIVAYFTTDSINYYVETTSMQANLRITQASLNLDAKKVTFENKTEYKFDITGLSGEKITLRYYGTSVFNAGTYEWKVGFNVDYKSDDGKKNYRIDSVADLTVLKADYDMSGITFKDGTFVYDGKAHMITIDGVLPTGLDGKQVTVEYSSEGLTDAGAVYVIASFSTESVNYNTPESMYAILTVEPYKLSLPVNFGLYDGQTTTFIITNFETGVGSEMVDLTYTTTSYHIGIYVWKDSQWGFEVTYTSPDGKQNYVIENADYFVITAASVTVTFDADHDSKIKTVQLDFPNYYVKRSDVSDVSAWEDHVNIGWYNTTTGALIDFDNDFFIENTTFKAKWQNVVDHKVSITTNEKELDIDLADAGEITDVSINFTSASVHINVTGMKKHLQVMLDDAVVNETIYTLTVKWEDAAYAGNVDVSLPYDSSKGEPVVYYYPAFGHPEDMKGVCDPSGKTITFSASHLDDAKYGVEYKTTPAPTPAQDDKTTIILAALVVLIAIGIGAYFYTKKH